MSKIHLPVANRWPMHRMECSNHYYIQYVKKYIEKRLTNFNKCDVTYPYDVFQPTERRASDAAVAPFKDTCREVYDVKFANIARRWF